MVLPSGDEKSICLNNYEVASPGPLSRPYLVSDDGWRHHVQKGAQKEECDRPDARSWYAVFFVSPAVHQSPQEGAEKSNIYREFAPSVWHGPPGGALDTYHGSRGVNGKQGKPRPRSSPPV